MVVAAALLLGFCGFRVIVLSVGLVVVWQWCHCGNVSQRGGFCSIFDKNHNSNNIQTNLCAFS